MAGFCHQRGQVAMRKDWRPWARKALRVLDKLDAAFAKTET
jgi:hypothetical protein